MKLSFKRQTFWNSFQDGLVETLIFNQVLGLTASSVLIIYGDTGLGRETIITALIFTNSVGFCIKFLGAIIHWFFHSSFSGKKFFSVAIWVPSIILGTLVGTEFAIWLNARLFGLFFPNLFSHYHLNLLTANLLIALTFSVVVFSFILIRKKLKQKIIENQRISHLQNQAQLIALQSKINPHFLFNTLNTMLSLVKKSPEKVEAIILNLSDIYRRILHYPEDEMIPLKEEIRLIKEYLEIEKIRMGDRLQFQITVDSEVENCLIPPLLIEPVVENAVIHGLGPKPGGGKMDIQVQKKGRMIEICVRDNGVGFSKDGQKGGFGLSSVKERLDLIYRDKAVFKITDLANGGIMVRMEIPHAD